MEQKICKYIQELHMMEQGDVVLIGVSGGADSVCLLLVLHALSEQIGFSVEVVHVEHGIRGEESLKDARFVEMLCKQLGVLYTQYSVDVLAFSKENHLGIEESARILRYEQFRKRAKQMEKPVKIALAHHMEDNAETILFQMIRGSGIVGLCGMMPIRQEEENIFIRPLLLTSRNEIEQYLQTKNQDYVFDSTNNDITYSRNRIRKEIIPALAEVNTQAVRHMNESARQLCLVHDFLRQQTKAAMDEMVVVKDNVLEINKNRFTQLHAAVQSEVIRQCIFRIAGKQKDILSIHISDVLSLFYKQIGKTICLPYGVIARMDYESLCLVKEPKEETSDWSIPQKIDACMLERCKDTGDSLNIILNQQGACLEISVTKYEQHLEEIPKKTYTKWFDYDKIKNGFLIRTRKQGDYFVQDTCGHRKKLSNYFIDEKIPAHKRDEMMLVAIDNEIVWLIGARIGENYKVQSDTTYILVMKYNGGKEHGLQDKA